tara:strand:+ start:500 stop:1228 length:729 start_codon:yes stop_codon:yes gene_type:complete
MRKPVVRLADLQTRAEAFSFLRTAFDKQLEAAIDRNADPNSVIAGDYNARQAFNALLSPGEQRSFFRQIVSDSRYWPRIRALIGSPPFTFLLPEDEGLLRAGGICRNRTNLSAKESSISKVHDFTGGHFYDDAERIYRVINHDHADSSLPWQNIGVQKQLIVDVRLKMYSQKTKVAIFRGTDTTGAQQASLMFPRPSESVKLYLVKHLETTGPYSITVKIDSGKQKARFSPIARLLVTVLKL